MNKVIQKLSTGIAIAAIAAFSAVPSAFADIAVAGNGSASSTDTQINSIRQLEYNQLANQYINNTVSNNANTGANDASFNTGSNVTINTGSANSTTNTLNSGGSNSTTGVASAGGSNGSGTAEVLGNGALSGNNVDISNMNRKDFTQAAESNYLNNVYNNLSTGNNTADFNTGSTVTIITGNASANTGNANQAGTNILR